MKRQTVIMILAFVSCTVSAQRRVIDVHPENVSPDGRIMEVADLFSRSSFPSLRTFHWSSDGSLAEGDAPEAEEDRRVPAGESDGIVYGGCVSRNEFGCDAGVFPSPSGRLKAVYRKDERRVSEFPLLDITTRTGSLKSVRYPMNGMPSERLSLCICTPEGDVVSTIVPDDFTEERYLTGVSWSPDDRYVFIQVLARSQHDMHLNMYRADDGSFVRTVLSEHDDAWVEPLDPIRFVKGSYRFIYRTDNRDGYRNLYLCDTLGRVERLTKVDADVEYAGNDGKNVFYTSAEVSPVENHLFRLPLKGGRAVNLTPERGWHNVSLSPDCTRFIDSRSSMNEPGTVCLRSAKDGRVIGTPEHSPDPLAGFSTGAVEFGTVPSADGKYDNYYRLFKPVGFDPSKKYPLIVYVYGGPHSQMVRDRWLAGVRLWEILMAQRGYVVYVQDGRGTSNRGADFEKAINRRCGQVEMEDQMAGIRTLLKEPWVDADRVGVHGWSYGGFMTISLMTSYPELFKVGVAGGPVIDWKWYEVMYGERYMDTPETNPEGFAGTSLMGKASKLKGNRLLICQGALDETVVWQHSLNFAQECVENDVPLDYFPYPRSEHNVAGKWRIHLYRKITAYFQQFL